MTTFKPTHYPIDVKYSSHVICEQVIYNREGFRILFYQKELRNFLQIAFHTPSSYRVTDEGRRLALDSQINYNEFCFSNEVLGSDYAKWFDGENLQQNINSNIRHFVFLAANEVIDVLSFDPPEVALIPLTTIQYDRLNER